MNYKINIGFFQLCFYKNFYGSVETVNRRTIEKITIIVFGIGGTSVEKGERGNSTISSKQLQFVAPNQYCVSHG